MLITLPPEQKKDKGVEGIMTTQLPRHGRARIFVCLVAIAGSHGAAAASIINIWNGAASGDGSYLNSGNIANTLAFTNVNVSATQEIRYIETVNLANGSFGQTFYFDAPGKFLGGQLNKRTLEWCIKTSPGGTWQQPDVVLWGRRFRRPKIR